jgi:hypothetical protein
MAAEEAKMKAGIAATVPLGRMGAPDRQDESVRHYGIIVAILHQALCRAAPP